MGKHENVFQKSIQDPEGFWGEAAEAITWYKKWDKVLDASNPPFYRWFIGGELNTCYNALDRHVENGRADQVALIYDSPVTKTIQKFTYRELLHEVSRFAGVLKSGVARDEADLKQELVQMIRNEIGPIACFKEAVVVTRLPKTRSGKIFRSTMRKIANAEPYAMPSTIDDPSILGEVEEALKKIGYAQNKKYGFAEL